MNVLMQCEGDHKMALRLAAWQTDSSVVVQRRLNHLSCLGENGLGTVDQEQPVAPG